MKQAPGKVRRREPEASTPVTRRLGRVVPWLAAGIVLGLGALAYQVRDAWLPTPAAPRADLGAAQAAVRGKVEAALAAVDEQPRSAAAWADLAMTYHAHAFGAEALACYDQAARLDPSEPRWPYLGALVLADSDPEGALERLEAAKAVGAEGLAVDWHEGNLLAELGSDSAAREAFERGLVHDPGAAPLLAGRGRLRLRAGDLDGALADLERAMRADPNWAESYVLLSQAYGRQGREDDASAAAKLARAAQQLEQLGPADPVYQAVIERGVSVRWLVRRGQLAVQAGRSEEAEAFFRQAIGADATEPAGYLGLGATLQGRGDLAGAIGQYRQALIQDPEDVEALTNLGLALAKSGKSAEGAEALVKALDLAPGHLGASINLALVQLDADDAEAALATVDKALRWQPGQRALLEARAGALSALERHAEAALAWEAVVALAPKDANPLVQQATALMRSSEHRQAIALLRRGLSTFPDSGLVKGSLAWELATAPDAELRNGQEAVDLARSLSAAMPGSAQAMDVLATALAEAGDWEEAVSAASAAVAAVGADDPLAPQMRARLASFEARRPYRQEAP